MPSVSNVANTILLPPQSNQILPPRSDDNGDSFEQMLRNSTVKQQQSDNSDSSSSSSNNSNNDSASQADSSEPSTKPAKSQDSQQSDQADDDQSDSKTSPDSDSTDAVKSPANSQPAQLPTPTPTSTKSSSKPAKTGEKPQPTQTTNASEDAVAASVSAAQLDVVLKSQPDQPQAQQITDKPGATTDAKPLTAVTTAAVEKLPTQVAAPKTAQADQPDQANVQANVQEDDQDAASQNQTDDETQVPVTTASAAKLLKEPATKRPAATDALGANQDDKTDQPASAVVAKTVKAPAATADHPALQTVAAVAGDATAQPASQTKSTAQPTITAIDATTTAKPQANSQAVVAKQAAPPQPSQADVDLAASNRDKIVTSVRTQLLPNGGTMSIRLDPPEMGQLQVTVRMNDGVMSASFETSNDQATKMLSHSLGQLKQALETSGVSVERLHVQQSPRDQQSGSKSSDDQKSETQQDGQSSQREQQRKEMLRRMWAKLGVGDPLDLVA
jgi:flagellar hook-length control protein FliK